MTTTGPSISPQQAGQGPEHPLSNLVEQIQRGCVERDTSQLFSRMTAGFMMQCTMLSSSDSLAIQRDLNRDLLQSVVDLTIESLTSKNSPAIETLKLQAMYIESVITQDEVAQQTQAAASSSKQQFSEAVLNHRQLSPSALDALFANIVSYILARSATSFYPAGPAGRDVSQASVFQATTTAARVSTAQNSVRCALGAAEDWQRVSRRETAGLVERIFPVRLLADFVTGQPQDKAIHLTELTDVVCGMRVLQAELRKKQLEQNKQQQPQQQQQQQEGKLGDELTNKGPNIGCAFDVDGLMVKNKAFEDRLRGLLGWLEPLTENYIAVIKCSVLSNEGVIHPSWQPKAGVERHTVELANLWQLIVFLRELLFDVVEMKSRISDLGLVYRQQVSDMMKIQEQFGGGTAVPLTTPKVLPPKFTVTSPTSSSHGSGDLFIYSLPSKPEYFSQYMALSRMRQQLGTELRQLDMREAIFNNIYVFLTFQSNEYPPPPSTGITTTETRSQEEQLNNPQTLSSLELSIRKDEVAAATSALAVLPPDTTSTDSSLPVGFKPAKGVTLFTATEFARLHAGAAKDDPIQTLLPSDHLAFKGFCPWSLVKHHGLLVEASKESGVVVFKDRVYRFINNKALTEFAMEPQKFIDSALNMIAHRPDLALLVELADQFSVLSGPVTSTLGTKILRLSKELRLKGAQSTASAQTEDHPVEEHIDKQYHWNEWALRKKAVQLVDLKNKRTVSTQTETSHFRRENVTQYWQPKSVGTQTGVTESTNTPTNKAYVAGLQGGPEREPRQIRTSWDLTEGQRLNLVQRNERTMKEQPQSSQSETPSSSSISVEMHDFSM